jgi:uncharacterized membrane protein
MPAAFTSWVLAVPLLGFATGLRTITPIAVLCWFAWLGYLPVEGTWAFWTANLISVVVFTLLALGEYIGDKLPQTPNRTALGPLLARLLFGGFVASIVATSIKLPGLGLNAVVLGIAGAAFGAYAGFLVRRQLVAGIGCSDWRVAVPEDLFALLSAVFAMRIVTR